MENKGVNKMTTIQTLAANAGKLSKSKVQQLLADLYAKSDDELLQNKLAGAYAHFMPALPKKAKTSFEWVCKARSKRAARYYINNAYSDGEYLVATDGHRLHYIPTELEEGYYDQNGDKIEVDATFPIWRRISPFFNDKPSDFDHFEFD